MSQFPKDVHKRKHVRFQPDPMDFAQIAIHSLGEPFTPELVALILDEAPLGGCALAILDNPMLTLGSQCLVKVGRMDPVRGEIVWKKEIEHNLMRLGIKYLE